jgi:hypothetical protein
VSSLADVRTKVLDSRFDWSKLEADAALAAPRVLDLLRETCLIESYMPVYTSQLMELFRNDLAAIEVLTIEAFEAYIHYSALRRYLDAVGYRRVTDADVLIVQNARRGETFSDPIRELVNLMATEQLAANFFTDLIDLVREPLLQSMLTVFAAEEMRHSQLAYDLLEARVAADPSIVDHVMAMAAEMRHVGSYVLPGVNPASDDNLETLVQLSRRIETLTGRPLTSIMLSRVEEARA